MSTPLYMCLFHLFNYNYIPGLSRLMQKTLFLSSNNFNCPLHLSTHLFYTFCLPICLLLLPCIHSIPSIQVYIHLKIVANAFLFFFKDFVTILCCLFCVYLFHSATFISYVTARTRAFASHKKEEGKKDRFAPEVMNRGIICHDLSL